MIRAFGVGLAIQRALGLFGGGKEFLREVCLSGVEHVQYGHSTFHETLVHAAIFSQRDHEQRWFERCLRHPRDGGGAKAFGTTGSEYIHAIRQ